MRSFNLINSNSNSNNNTNNNDNQRGSPTRQEREMFKLLGNELQSMTPAD